MSLALGTTRRGRALTLSAEERSWHVQLVGGSGRGKSSLLESMIRQDILAGRGLCLIDPHGTLADDIVAWCAERGVDRYRRIHVIEASDLEWCASFNPLRRDGVSDPSVRVDAMVAACAQVWGGEDSNRTPLLRKCLTAVFYTLSVRSLSLVEATELVSSVDPHHVRRRLTENLPDPVFDTLWQDFNGLKRSEFAEQFSSTTSRLNLFLKSPSVRRMLGQTERALDLKQVMDGGEVLIVNLATKNKLSHENVRLLGTLLTSDLFLLAVGRDRALAKRRPFTLYLDEAGDFLTDDVERMLDQTRKFGLHVVLSHQRLAQLRRRSDLIHDAVLGGTHTKIIFGGLMDDEAEVMAREVYRGSFNLERPKRVLDKPVVVDEVPFWLESESDTDSTSTTSTMGDTDGGSSGWGVSDGVAEQWDPNDPWAQNPFNRTVSAGANVSEGSSWSWHSSFGESAGRSRTQGRTQTLKPVRVMMPSAVYSLEEELHLAIVKLRALPRQACIVKRPTGYPVRIKPFDINPSVAGRYRSRDFVDKVRAASQFTVASDVADIEIAARLAALRRTDAPMGDDQFFSE